MQIACFLTFYLLGLHSLFCNCISDSSVTDSKKSVVNLLTERYKKYQSILGSTSRNNLTAYLDSAYHIILEDRPQKLVPLIVETHSTCPEISCHRILSDQFAENHIILDHRNAVIFTSRHALQKFIGMHPLVITDHLFLLPMFKTQNDLLDSNFVGSVRKIRVIVFKIQALEFLLFTKEIANIEVDMDSPEKCQGVCVAIVSFNGLGDLPTIVNALSSRDEVFWIEPVHEVRVHNRWSRGLSDTGNFAFTPLTDYNLTGIGHVMGVVDTGIDMSSCYFYQPNCQTPYSKDGSVINRACRKVIQYVAFADRTDDSAGHGTHVAGIASGSSYLSYGDYVKYNGNSADAKIAFFDIGNSSSSGEGLLLPKDYNTQLFVVLYSSGARVISNSWGSAGNTYDSQAQQADLFMWRNPDALLVFSAGNTGCLSQCEGTVGSPAVLKNGLTVGASLNDHQSWQYYIDPSIGSMYGSDSMAAFSSKGPTSDGRMKPDIMAVGSYVTSASVTATPNSKSLHCSIKALEGTSMSAPVAAAYALKVRQYFTSGYYPSGTPNPKDAFNPSGALLKAILIHSGQPVHYSLAASSSGSSIPLNQYPSNLQGYGRIQLNKALNFARSSLSPLSLFIVGGANISTQHFASIRKQSQKDSYTFRLSKASSVRITMAYTDYPGSPAASTILINSLSITVKDLRTNAIYSPYLASGTKRGNVQMIDLPLSATVANSSFTAVVAMSSGASLTHAQPYALVISGPLTPLTGQAHTFTSSAPADDTSLSTGVIIYLCVLSFGAALLFALVYYFKSMTTKSIFLDPLSFLSFSGSNDRDMERRDDKRWGSQGDYM